MNKLTLGTIAILGVVAILSAALVVVPTQEADARSSPKVIQKQSNKCRGNAFCSNTATLTIKIGSRGGDGPDN